MYREMQTKDAKVKGHIYLTKKCFTQ